MRQESAPEFTYAIRHKGQHIELDEPELLTDKELGSIISDIWNNPQKYFNVGITRFVNETDDQFVFNFSEYVFTGENNPYIFEWNKRNNLPLTLKNQLH